MQRPDYNAWALKHGTLFGFAFDSDAAMIRSWFEVLCHYDLAELHAATAEIARATVPERRPADHLPAIHRAILHLRAVEVERYPDSRGPNFGDCNLCGSGGWVMVPDLRGVRDGQWLPLKAVPGCPVYYTCSVLCTCPMGRWMKGRQKGLEKPATALEQYERENPDWKVQLALQQRAQLAQARQRPSDDRWQSLVTSLLRSAGGREPGCDDE